MFTCNSIRVKLCCVVCVKLCCVVCVKLCCVVCVKLCCVVCSTDFVARQHEQQKHSRGPPFSIAWFSMEAWYHYCLFLLRETA